MNILTLINEKSYGWLIFLLFLIYVTWFIFYKLSFKIINEKMPPLIYLAVLIMGSYAFGARPFFPGIPFLGLMCALMIILMCIFGRLSIYKSIYGSFFTIFLSFLGNVFIYYVVLAFFPSFFPFLIGEKFGFLIGLGIEVIFPILALILIPKYSLRLPLRKTSPFDLFDMAVSWTLLCMYIVMDVALTTTLEAFQKNPHNVGSSLGILFMATLGILGGVVGIIKCMKIMADREIKKLQDENRRVDTEKNILMGELKKYRILNGVDNDQQLGSIVNDYTLKIFDIALEVARSSLKKPRFIPNEINLRKFRVNSKNGEILGWIVLDLSYAEIGDIVYLSESAVRSRAHDMIKKFGLKNREELAKFAIENDLIKLIDE
jgi:DNA-binding CsgD family transcriptional regulator